MKFLTKLIALGGILTLFQPPRIRNPHKIIDGIRWHRVFAQKMFINAQYPLYGISMIEVKPENLHKVMTNFGKQIFLNTKDEYDEPIIIADGIIYHQEQYNYGENIRIIIIMEWPTHLRDNLDMVTDMDNPIKAWLEFMELVETYNWMCTSDITDDFSIYKELFELNLN
ncbi:hypothetical protein AN639_11070 [Candidatus Epulonipiscium fishelsonii]|uniref:Uncharacterized protein n=1 Tax=Candidatus Epulonipiscium fishelsonii TaxID=77094 RepID=A0ACC8XCN1_9FIRM|nr:hypothetical protein AN396_05895 [Epulopiscium sp. SCG-B11WGA-EpuloA1]ONI43213.1 hypothetical protein AN639_11070 [Epulopiscium sp. SCG-B05WGA-EpuloA1]